MTTLTPEKIEKLLARFDRFAVRQHQNGPALREITEQLEHVPAGQDNRVDLLLGRPSAQLPPSEAIRDSIAAAIVDAIHRDMERKRIVMVQHIDGSQDIADDFKTHCD